jgi:hypothetical protein
MICCTSLLASPDGRPSTLAYKRHAPLQLLPLDDLRRRRLDDLGDLPQRHHPQLAVGAVLARAEIEVAEVAARRRLSFASCTFTS